jgi:hypothetical protein
MAPSPSACRRLREHMEPKLLRSRLLRPAAASVASCAAVAAA